MQTTVLETRFLISALCILCVACVDGDGMSEYAVTSIDAGDGSEQLQVQHEAELLMVDCAGLCGLIELTDDLAVSTCDLGLRESVTVDVGIDRGVAVVDLRGSVRLSRLEGAAYADGSFDVGGVASVGGGTSSFRRFRGRLSGDPAVPEGWSLRTAIDFVANADPCVATYEVLSDSL